MKIKISGMSGYLGTLISDELITRGHQVESIPRSLLFGEISLLKKHIEGADIIIHLSGSPILTRWSQKKRKEIYDSRVQSTKNLVEAIKMLEPGKRPRKFIQASAIGIYKPGKIHNEDSADFEAGFIGQVATDWEKASTTLPEDVNRIVFRIGLVIGKEAKTITNLLLPFKLGLGATIGSGKQYFPFIHENDLARAFVWAVNQYSQNGIFNLTSPVLITNKQFTRSFAKSVNRNAFFIIPEFAIKLVLGEASVLLTDIPGAVPSKLLEEGFEFQYPEIEKALKNILKDK
jgi:uncharacterized protein (TIGR01777 family)